MTDRICDTSHNNTVALNTSHNNTAALNTSHNNTIAFITGGRDYNKVKGLQAAFSKIRPLFCSKTHTGTQVHYSGYGVRRHGNTADV